ncbi:MAG TPA: hypothetical protein V6D19_13105 [Stenomitos sp.]
MKKPSEIFEGPNSSLRKTFDEVATPTQELDWETRFDDKFNFVGALRATQDGGSVSIRSVDVANDIKSFIKSEIERAVKEYKPLGINSIFKSKGKLYVATEIPKDAGEIIDIYYKPLSEE